MNAIEIRNLTKTYGQKTALAGLNMTVPEGAIYGFIGENGSGKSTTEKAICGLIVPTGGTIKLFGKDYRDQSVRSQIGVLIETPGCFPNLSVWQNMQIQAANLGIKNADAEIRQVLRLVRMEGSAANKFKNCSLGMKQRIGIAFALLGHPKLLVLDEPINGLDADGMRIMREVLIDITQNLHCTVLISSHILGELEKIATHYGIIRGGKMIQEMTAAELEKNCPTFVAVQTNDNQKAKTVLDKHYPQVRLDNNIIRVYGSVKAADVVDTLYAAQIIPTAVKTAKINLEEYYINLMQQGGQK